MPNRQSREPGSSSARLLALLAVGLVVLAAMPSTGSAVSTPTLVRDINSSPVSGSPEYFANVGGTLFFAAADGAGGRALWKSDGTEEGTVLVKDFGESGPFNLAAGGGQLFFAAVDDVHGVELWTSDGTEAGTVFVKDINTTGDSYPSGFTRAGGTIYFVADDGVHGRGLWKTDGSEAGTLLVKDINSGLGFSPFYDLTAFGDVVLFFTDDGVHGLEPWTSDGTEAGTVLLKDINATGDSHAGSFTTSSPTELGGTVFFWADDGVHGRELWKSDGTEAGTLLLKDINALGGSGAGFDPSLTEAGGMLLFAADDGVHGRELWKSDGTEAGTALLKDIVTGGDASSPEGFASAGGTCFFAAYDGVHGYELWKTDGTQAGTVLVKDINAAARNSSPHVLVDVGGTLFFWAKDGMHGWEPWKSDGTEAGTMILKDINAAGSSLLSYSSPLVEAGGKLFLAAHDGVHGLELWKSDGTEAGTVLLKDSAPGTWSSAAAARATVNGVAILVADDSIHGDELWRTDGTEAGTALVKDVNRFGDSYPRGFTKAGGSIFFAAVDGIHGEELWKTDGTLRGTVLVKNIHRDSPYSSYGNGSNSSELTKLGSRVLFSAADGRHGEELWRSDGTRRGTVLLKDINPSSHGDSSSSSPSQFARLGDRIFFSAWDGEHERLWTTDGTREGTASVPGSPAFPRGIVGLGKNVYFRGYDRTHGRELWRSDGTRRGTVLVKDIRPGSRSSVSHRNSFSLTVSANKLFFAADDGVHGRELWVSDGTRAGTGLVKDISPGAAASLNAYDPRLSFASGTVFFTADDGVHGPEPWTSDGTEAGTAMLADIAPGQTGSNSGGYLGMNGTTFFSADDLVHGVELWKTDGTALGTSLVTDLNPGGSANADGLFKFGSTLLFSADDALHGSELWSLAP